MSRDERKLRLYGAATAIGWRIVRHRVSFAEGQRRVDAGEWAEVYDELNNHVGYQVLAMREVRGDVDLKSLPLPVCITAGQTEMVIGGHSKTVGLSEAERLERAASKDPWTGKLLEPEDEVERVGRKVQVYPHVGAAKGDILRVWPLDAAAPLTVGV